MSQHITQNIALQECKMPTLHSHFKCMYYTSIASSSEPFRPKAQHQLPWIKLSEL